MVQNYPFPILKVIFIYKFLGHVSTIDKFKTKVLGIIKKLSEECFGRVVKTKKLKHEWRDELNKLESKDEFKIDYSKPENQIIGKILTTNDAKSSIKANVFFILNLVENSQRTIKRKTYGRRYNFKNCR